MAYERVHGPIDNRRGDFQAALVAQLIAAAFRGKGKPVPQLTNFLLEFDREAQTPEQMLAIVAQIAEVTGD